MKDNDASESVILAELRARAEQRFGGDRAAALNAELAVAARAVARVLAEPLELDGEPPLSWPALEERT